MIHQLLSRSFLSNRTTVLAAAAGFWCVSSANADVWNVPGDAPTIQVAINLSSAGDEIEVEPSTYFEKIDLLGKTLVIRSTGGSAVTIIDALGQFDPVIKIISGEGPETRIEGFTIRNGEALNAAPNERGGGVYCNLTSPTFVDCVFVDNEAGIGGAFYSNAGVVDFIDCVFDQNHATGTGGVAYQNGGTVNYTDCVFTGNTADSHAGAIRHVGADGTYTRCLFDGNQSGANGGALDMAGGSSSMTYRDCEFMDNTAVGVGGAVQLATPDAVGDTITWINCLFRGNDAGGNGGAMHVLGRGDFINCTFYDNSTAGGGGGGGIYTQGTATSLAKNCVAWGNAPNGFNGATTATYCNIQNVLAGVGNISVDPLFVDAPAGDFRLQDTSPCLDAGNTTLLPLSVATDFDLLPRALNALNGGETGVAALGYFADMGAFEFQPAGGPGPCPADTNGDGVVNVTDLLNLLAAWGSCF